MRYQPDPHLSDWHLYYCYADDGQLLYVGIARDPQARVGMHNNITTSLWMYGYCTRVVVWTDPMTWREALTVEAQQIRSLRPVFNVLHNPNPTQWTPVNKANIGSYPSIRWSFSKPSASVVRAIKDGELEAHYLNGTSPRVHRADLDAWVLAAPTERRTA